MSIIERTLWPYDWIDCISLDIYDGHISIHHLSRWMVFVEKISDTIIFITLIEIWWWCMSLTWDREKKKNIQRNVLYFNSLLRNTLHDSLIVTELNYKNNMLKSKVKLCLNCTSLKKKKNLKEWQNYSLLWIILFEYSVQFSFLEFFSKARSIKDDGFIWILKLIISKIHVLLFGKTKLSASNV